MGEGLITHLHVFVRERVEESVGREHDRVIGKQRAFGALGVGGRAVYVGATKDAQEYFEKHLLEVAPPRTNLADFFTKIQPVATFRTQRDEIMHI